MEKPDLINKKFLLTNSIFVLLIYFITIINVAIARLLNIIAFNTYEYILLSLICGLLPIINVLTISLYKETTFNFARNITIINLLYSLFSFVVYLYFLNENRIFGLAFAILVFTFYIFFSNVYRSLLISFVVYLLYVGTLFIFSHYFYQHFNMKKELFFSTTTLLFLLIVTFLASGTLNRQKKEIYKLSIKMFEYNKYIESDLLLARKIQESIIPKNITINNISTLYKPMMLVGGDYYDFIKFDNNSIGIFYLRCIRPWCSRCFHNIND